MTEILKLSEIGVTTKIGQGGQGAVYAVPRLRTKFTKSLVYKEYHDGSGGKPDLLSTLNVAALKAMPEFLESLPFGQGADLIEIAAWPCRIVEDHGRVRGFVMPSIPDEFFIDLYTAKGSSRVMADFQHILNDPSIVAMRLNGRIITEREKFELLGKAASALDFLHSHNVCVGDISPVNLLFSLSGPPAVYFVDCDAMRVNGVSLTHQLETPGWEIPGGEEKATPYSDRFKFGLLALRLLVGDQDTRDPSRLPSSVPAEVRQLIAETLKNPPTSRPGFSRWESALEQAARQAPAQPSNVPVPKAKNTIRPLPPQHGSQTQTPVPPPYRPQPQPQPHWPPSTLPPATPKVRSGKAAWLATIAVLGFIFLLVKMATNSPGSSTSAYTSTTAAYPTYNSTPQYEPATPTRTTTSPPTPAGGVRPPGAVIGLDVNNDECNAGFNLTNYSGWATQSVRGSSRTSCQFARNVLSAYWDQYSAPSKDRRTVYARGAVLCSSVPGAECTPDERFVMTCEGSRSQDWITCTGGSQAVVYLY
jgi:serine/threonine protein kinase